MAERPDSAPKRRGPTPRLSREQIITATAGLLEEHPADEVTMARVAEAVGASPMALYRHVKSRSDLMDGVLEAVLEGVAPQIPQHASWDEVVESWMHSVRAHLIRAPGAMAAVALGGRMSPIMLESLADLAQSLEAGGFDEDQRVAAIVTIARTTKGWVIQELAHPVSREVEAITAGLPEISAEARDVLAVLIPKISKLDDEQAFEWIVQQVVVNLQRILDE